MGLIAQTLTDGLAMVASIPVRSWIQSDFRRAAVINLGTTFWCGSTPP
jgi:hypothetical protein